MTTAPGSGERAQLFDTSDDSDEGVGAAAAATAAAGGDENGAGAVDATTEGADDGRRGRRRTATASGAFAGRPAALVDDLTLPQRAAVEHRGGPLLIIAGVARARRGC